MRLSKVLGSQHRSRILPNGRFRLEKVRREPLVEGAECGPAIFLALGFLFLGVGAGPQHPEVTLPARSYGLSEPGPGISPGRYAQFRPANSDSRREQEKP